MGNQSEREIPAEPFGRTADLAERLRLPRPTLQFRRRAWLAFQRALDPLGPPRPLPRQRTPNG